MPKVWKPMVISSEKAVRDSKIAIFMDLMNDSDMDDRYIIGDELNYCTPSGSK
jgi:hypothetical protein